MRAAAIVDPGFLNQSNKKDDIWSTHFARLIFGSRFLDFHDQIWLLSKPNFLPPLPASTACHLWSSNFSMRPLIRFLRTHGASKPRMNRKPQSQGQHDRTQTQHLMKTSLLATWSRNATRKWRKHISNRKRWSKRHLAGLDFIIHRKLACLLHEGHEQKQYLQIAACSSLWKCIGLPSWYVDQAHIMCFQ